MRLIFDLLNGVGLLHCNVTNSQVYTDVPRNLPEFLVPSSKAHLIAANSALEHGLNMERAESPEPASAQGLKDDFDWYMSPTDRSSYDSIHSANSDRRGGVKFNALTELYSTLDVPERDVETAWNLVNPKNADSIGKDQTLTFLHILNQRHKGSRVPKSIPPSLRATFQKSEINYDTSKARAKTEDNLPATPKKAAFAGEYLSKLGIGKRDGGAYSRPGTDFTSTKDEDWEEVRLKRQLADLESQIAEAENQVQQRKIGKTGDGQSKIVLVRNELEQLLQCKERQLHSLENTSDDTSSGLQSIRKDIEMFQSQIDTLASYLEDRQHKLAELESIERA